MNETRLEWLASLKIGDEVIDKDGYINVVTGIEDITTPYLPLSLGYIVGNAWFPKSLAKVILTVISDLAERYSLFEVVERIFTFKDGSTLKGKELIWVHPKVLSGLNIKLNQYDNWIIQHRDHPIYTIVLHDLKDGVEKMDHHIRERWVQ